MVTPELRMSSEQAQCPGWGLGTSALVHSLWSCTGAIPSFLRLLGTLEEALPSGGYGRRWEHLLPFFQESTKVWIGECKVSSAKLSLIIIPSSSQEMASPHRISQQDQGADLDSALLPSPKSAMCPAAKMNANWTTSLVSMAHSGLSLLPVS